MLLYYAKLYYAILRYDVLAVTEASDYVLIANCNVTYHLTITFPWSSHMIKVFPFTHTTYKQKCCVKWYEPVEEVLTRLTASWYTVFLLLLPALWFCPHTSVHPLSWNWNGVFCKTLRHESYCATVRLFYILSCRPGRALGGWEEVETLAVLHNAYYSTAQLDTKVRHST